MYQFYFLFRHRISSSLLQTIFYVVVTIINKENRVNCHKKEGKKRLDSKERNWTNRFSTSNRIKNLVLSEIIRIIHLINLDKYRYVYKNLIIMNYYSLTEALDSILIQTCIQSKFMLFYGYFSSFNIDKQYCIQYEKGI